MIDSNIIEVMSTKKLQVEQILQSDDFDPQKLSEILDDFLPLIKELSVFANTDESVVEHLTDLNLWYSLMVGKIIDYKEGLAENIKKISAARKADHNYRLNR